jgi:hypothetical protein
MKHYMLPNAMGNNYEQEEDECCEIWCVVLDEAGCYCIGLSIASKTEEGSDGQDMKRKLGSNSMLKKVFIFIRS